jgi:hypothetical protein
MPNASASRIEPAININIGFLNLSNAWNITIN